ncbi:eIF2 kinase IF2K-D [Babesia caballi]|uniref:EIF2 kinase IF2K-D n=1 Tax=Babesia caballi TaxID=5871 RepID=A0AAV4M216_BABCB|nr:eIF2 kinase IF2K-D [Babesia caballi]
MEESLPEHLQAQLDEVHALHYIFYPATVQCRGGIAAEMFAEDLMPPEEYLELLSRLTIRTRLELYAESVEGTPPESLLKVGFRVSPYTGDFSHSTKRPQSFIEVTFPAEYPAVLPRIAIMMNMSLAEQSKAELVSRLNRAVRDTQGGICVFNVAISLNEVLSDIHAKQYRLWDEATSETLDIDHHQATSFESSTSVQRLYSLDNPKLHRVFSSTRLTSDKPTATPDHPTAGGRPDNAEMLPQSHRNSASSAHEASTVDREMYSSSFDIAGWSLQSLIQSPLWYETGRRSLEEGQRETSSRFLVRQGSTFRGDERHWPPFGLPVQAHRTWSNEFESQADTTDVGTDNTSALPSELGRASSCLPIPREVRAEACSLDTETLLTISRSMALIDFLASLSSVERYRQDFTETMTILQNSFSSFVKAQHMLDQNLYMVRTYTLPNFCVLETQHADFEPKDDIERFGARRKSIIHQLVSSVALLARLQHNSIARYYQCWVEKVQQFDVISQLLRRGEALLEGDHRALSGEDGDPDSLSHWVQYLLLNNSSLRDEASVAEFIMGEAVTRRRMYIQMEHCDGTSLDQVIQHDSLYKNPQRIWTFTRHLLDVLAYLHSNNAYHQALSLKNIIVYTDAAGTGVKVCEFGIARLLRQFCYTGFFCQHAHCACREYSRQLRRELFAYHPSTFGVGDPVNFADQLALQVVSDYDAQQEDMFALGVLIFRMWHPPIEERPFKELFTSVIATKKFPQYFLQSTPEIIVSTIVRLVSAERRPTAVELLSETLVPPVMNSDLYKQYLRRLQNPLSDEAVDALRAT